MALCTQFTQGGGAITLGQAPTCGVGQQTVMRVGRGGPAHQRLQQAMQISRRPQVLAASDQGDILRRDGRDCIAPFDAIPFATTTPVPMTHRFFGRSIAELAMPLQREKTALKRAALDNLRYTGCKACR